MEKLDKGGVQSFVAVRRGQSVLVSVGGVVSHDSFAVINHLSSLHIHTYEMLHILANP